MNSEEYKLEWYFSLKILVRFFCKFFWISASYFFVCYIEIILTQLWRGKNVIFDYILGSLKSYRNKKLSDLHFSGSFLSHSLFVHHG